MEHRTVPRSWLPVPASRPELIGWMRSAQHARGIGAFTRNGRMVDDAVAVLARRTLARAGVNSQEAR